MTPTKLELIQEQYSELKELCRYLKLDVKLLDMPLSQQKKESLKAIIPQDQIRVGGFSLFKG